MYPVIGKCPVCGNTMAVTRLHCRSCDSALEGQFSLGRFYQLTPQQLAFVETFIRCEGKLTRVQDELAMSYPTARARLTDVIAPAASFSKMALRSSTEIGSVSSRIS